MGARLTGMRPRVRGAAFASLLIAAAVLWAGCSRSREGEVVLRLSGWSSSPEESKLLETQLAEFESLHPGVRIKYEPIVGDYMQKLQVLFASKTEPDVFYLDSKDIARMTYYGVLEPMDGYLEEAGEDLDDFYENLIATFRGADGRLYGLPKGFSTIALYYNKDIFEKAGIGGPPGTWDELLAASGKLKARGIAPLCLTADMKTIHLVAGLKGGTILKDEKRLAFLDAPAREGIASLLELLDEERGYAKLPQDFGGAWTGDTFAKGQAAMILEGMWVAPYLKMRSSELSYGVAPVPRMKSRFNMIFTVAYVVSKRSQHKREAVELARYLTGREGLGHVAELGLEIPSRKSVARADFLKRFPERRPFLEAVEYAAPYRYGVEGNRLLEELPKAVDAARLKQMPLDKALERAARKLERFYGAGE